MKYAILLLITLQCLCSSLLAQPPVHEKWKMVWSDEFNGNDSDLDTGWNSFNGGYKSTSINCSRWRRNAVEENGVLKLLYKKEATSGGSGTSAWSYNWTAGSIFTKRKFQYGYFECRYKVAGTVGTNNSFWLISSKNKDTSIKTFEIDINEGWYSASSTNGRQQIRTNVHNWSDISTAANGSVTHPQQSVKFNPNPWYNIATQYHTMGLEWNEKELIWYLDGKVIRRVANQNKYGAIANCFDAAPVYLSAATITFDLPQPDSLDGKWMEVDYVRVYQKDSTVTDVHACVKDSVMLVTYPGIPDATTYRWEVSTFSNGAYNAWSALSTGPTGTNSTNGFGASYSGVTNDTLIIRNVNTGLQQARYRCRLTTTRSSNTTAYPAAPYIRYADTSVITVNPTIKAAITVPAVNYLGATVHLSASATGGTGNYTHYIWNGPANLADTTKDLFIANFQSSNNGAYTVNVMDSLGCSDTATVNVTATTAVNQPVVINMLDTINVIAFDDINVQPTIIGGSGIYTSYWWRGVNNFTSNLSALQIQGLRASDSGLYTLYVTDNTGFMASKSIYVSVAKRSQTIRFNAIPNSSYTGSQSLPINLSATASSGLTVQYQSSNTVYGSIVQDKLVANYKRPDYSVQLNKPIVTNRIRIFSSQAAYFHIRELKIFAPIQGSYPDPLLDVMDSGSLGWYNYATKTGVVVTASGTLDATNAGFAARNVIDGRVATSWVSQQTGDKFIEVTLPNSVSVGGIQFVNGFFSGGVWNGILSSFLLQYHDGTAWQNIDCNTNIYAIQNGDENTEPASTAQNLCINTTAKTITNTTALPVTIVTFSLLQTLNSPAYLSWTVANEVNLAHYAVEASKNGFEWQTIALVAPNSNNGKYSYSIEGIATQFAFYRLKIVDIDAQVAYSQVVKASGTAQQEALKIFPNPVGKWLTVSGIHTSVSYRIKNNIGWQMASGIATNQPIDVQQLPQGWYIIELTGTNQRKVIPFFKQ